MALNIGETLEAFVKQITSNKEIMDILALPTILKTDTIEIKRKKRKMLIDKCILTQAQDPYELNKKFPEIIIEGERYNHYGDIRLTITLAQSIKMNSDIFGNPQVDFNIYYDNTKEMNNVFKLLSLISDEFSGKTLIVPIENGKQMIKDLKCEGLSSQVAIINNYERVGIRFSFYSTLYKI